MYVYQVGCCMMYDVSTGSVPTSKRLNSAASVAAWHTHKWSSLSYLHIIIFNRYQIQGPASVSMIPELFLISLSTLSRHIPWWMSPCLLSLDNLYWLKQVLSEYLRQGHGVREYQSALAQNKGDRPVIFWWRWHVSNSSYLFTIHVM